MLPGRGGTKAGRPGEGHGVPLVPGGGAARGGQGQEGGLHREREESDRQETRTHQPHRQSTGCSLSYRGDASGTPNPGAPAALPSNRLYEKKKIHVIQVLTLDNFELRHGRLPSHHSAVMGLSPAL